MTTCCIHHTYPTSQTSSELGLHWRLPWHASHPALRRSWKAIWMTSRGGDLKIASSVRAHVSDQGKGTEVTVPACFSSHKRAYFTISCYLFLSDMFSLRWHKMMLDCNPPAPAFSVLALLSCSTLLCFVCVFQLVLVLPGIKPRALNVPDKRSLYHWTALPALRTYFDRRTTYL